MQGIDRVALTLLDCSPPACARSSRSDSSSDGSTTRSTSYCCLEHMRLGGRWGQDRWIDRRRRRKERASEGRSSELGGR